ncbi:unnamed protein product [Didymodactylos carnosus]|uniref:Uncharacterized protein n=1 Tax=Didymodactylos carnosus TaxID=1234261 RepID=A0A813PVK6_9BILA|nr:unnamed protein product [Didymodactylos carnosus]CAF3538916.1 unnamed protein product [Didymodactylos carnosus]
MPRKKKRLLFVKRKNHTGVNNSGIRKMNSKQPVVRVVDFLSNPFNIPFNIKDYIIVDTTIDDELMNNNNSTIINSENRLDEKNTMTVEDASKFKQKSQPDSATSLNELFSVKKTLNRLPHTENTQTNNHVELNGMEKNINEKEHISIKKTILKINQGDNGRIIDNNETAFKSNSYIYKGCFDVIEKVASEWYDKFENDIIKTFNIKKVDDEIFRDKHLFLDWVRKKLENYVVKVADTQSLTNTNQIEEFIYKIKSRMEPYIADTNILDDILNILREQLNYLHSEVQCHSKMHYTILPIIQHVYPSLKYWSDFTNKLAVLKDAAFQKFNQQQQKQITYEDIYEDEDIQKFVSKINKELPNGVHILSFQEMIKQRNLEIHVGYTDIIDQRNLLNKCKQFDFDDYRYGTMIRTILSQLEIKEKNHELKSIR